MIQLIYVGKRCGADYKMYYRFKEVGTNNQLDFSTKLGDFTVIGDIIECERTDKGVKAPYTKIGRDDENVMRYSVDQSASIEKHKEYLESKKPVDGSIDALIAVIKANTDSMTARKRIVRYITGKLL